MNKFLFFCLFTLLPVCSQAQEVRALRGNCTPTVLPEDGDAAGARGPMPRRLPSINRNIWDILPEKHSIVVLVEFNDQRFGMEDPRNYYERVFNEHGYNERNGLGCVADYFRDQSDGRCDITFDIYGPVTVDESAKMTGGSYRAATFRKALQAVVDEEPEDSRMGDGCDWDNNGSAQQVVFVYAGLGGNVDNGGEESGCIWPHTASFSKVTLPNGLTVSNYTVSSEMMTLKRNSGIGTICHEFSHSLGLPDLYPTSSSSKEFSVVDEWDLMDGGNFTDYGWCPPNYSSLEKYLLGLSDPTELTDATSIIDMLAVSEGGKTYQVKKHQWEYYMLENRQWSGWDACLPGHGLVIFHVDYDLSAWSGNSVNNDAQHHRYDLFHADNMDYNDWDEILYGTNPTVNNHSRYLCTSTYPYIFDGEVVNNELTDKSLPAATVFDSDGFMSKPITKISEDEYGYVAFDFMGGDISTIERAPLSSTENKPSRAYDLQGRPAFRSVINILDGKKLIRY